VLIAEALPSFAPLAVLAGAWLAVPGALCAALLLGLMLPALRLPVQLPVAAAVTALTLWMVAAGLWCWRGR
jgi:hypothetical protein